MPLCHAGLVLHFRQTRSPAPSLGNCPPHIRHRRSLRTTSMSSPLAGGLRSEFIIDRAPRCGSRGAAFSTAGRPPESHEETGITLSCNAVSVAPFRPPGRLLRSFGKGQPSETAASSIWASRLGLHHPIENCFAAAPKHEETPQDRALQGCRQAVPRPDRGEALISPSATPPDPAAARDRGAARAWPDAAVPADGARPRS